MWESGIAIYPNIRLNNSKNKSSKLQPLNFNYPLITWVGMGWGKHVNSGEHKIGGRIGVITCLKLNYNNLINHN